MRNVVITGIGMRTPMGHTLDAVRGVYESGKSVIRLVEGPGGRLRALAKMDDDFTAGFSRMDQLLLDPLALMTQHAADDAVADSGMDLETADRSRIGVYLGSGQGASQTKYDAFTSLATNDSIKTYTILRGLDNGAANQVAIRHQLRGACEAVVLACSSSNAAMGQALRAIRHGYLDAALSGGAEATFTEGVIRAWEAMRVLAKFDPEHPETCSRPFSKDRTGLVLGEGAVLYMLEAEEHALARGARIYARIAGYGSSCDATHISAPDPAGQALAMTACLRDAGLEPADIDYINAHGTATPVGDPIEVRAIRKAMGSHAEQVPVSSTKSLHGHLLGAAGAIELLAVIIAMRDGVIAPTANLHEPDPECDLDFVPNQARRGATVKAALASNFAFGGSNACLALIKP
jgi:3-oxoacyl-[acyl-carrier-protein] synthase II